MWILGLKGLKEGRIQTNTPDIPTYFKDCKEGPKKTIQFRIYGSQTVCLFVIADTKFPKYSTFYDHDDRSFCR